MASASPFGQPNRMRVLQRYFENAGPVTVQNAWEHVYRCMLWMDEGAGLAHIYDSNHMQRGGSFHPKAVRFTDALCERWALQRRELGQHLDVLFKGCVEELRRQEAEAARRAEEAKAFLRDLMGDEDVEATEQQGEGEDPSELVTQIQKLLAERGINDSAQLASMIERKAHDHFTIGKKRSNALGEGFEDLLTILIQQVANVPVDRIRLRTPVSKLPGFRKSAPPPPGKKKRREPTPDIAIVEQSLTHVIVTAKWSLRQDRLIQFAGEYRDFQNSKGPNELNYSLVTNEFDLPRLGHVLDATPTGEGGYIFHHVYHINLDLFLQTHGDIGRLRNYVGLGKLQSLQNLLEDLKAQFGS